MNDLSVRGLSASLDGRAVLKDVSFDAGIGITMLLGPNGCGKSTLLRSLSGIIPCRGSAFLNGEDILSMGARRRAAHLAYLPQRQIWDSPISVREYVSLGAGVSQGLLSPPNKKALARADETLAALGLTSFSDRAMNRLSGGEARMAGIARAMAQPGDFMLLDEPLAGLDFRNSHEILGLIRRMGKNSVISIHDPALAWQYGDKTLLMNDGRIVAEGARGQESAFEEPLRRVYGQNMEFTRVHGLFLPMWRNT